MLSLLGSLLLVLIFLVLNCVVLDLFLRWKRRYINQLSRSVPMPDPGIPIFGHIHHVWGGPEMAIRNGCEFYRKFNRSNIKVWVFHRIYIIVVKPEDIAVTLGSSTFNKKSSEYNVMQQSVMGQGLFSTASMPEWKKNRKLITPAFHFTILKSFINVFYEEATTLSKKLIEKMDEDGEVEVYRLMALCTLDMIMRNAMGVKINAQENCQHKFVRCMDTIMEVWHTRIFKPWLLNEFIFSFSSLKKMHDQATKDVQQFAMEVILRKVEEKYCKQNFEINNENLNVNNEDSNYCSARKNNVFLDLLIQYMYECIDQNHINRIIKSHRKTRTFDEVKTPIQKFMAAFKNCIKRTEKHQIDSNNDDNNNDGEKEDSFLSKKKHLERLNNQITDEVVTIMIGGQETTACENSFAVLLLAMHQDVQKKVYSEIEAIFSTGDSERAPSYEDLQKMEYLECVIKETMRLYPALPAMGRVAQENTVLSDNSVIPKGSTAVFFLYGLHRDARYFPEPDKFKPERFLPENSHDRHPYAYIPFSGGQRNCIGQKYAMLQMKTVISTLIRKFQFLPSEKMPDESHIRLQMTTTLRSKTGNWIKLERRQAVF